MSSLLFPSSLPGLDATISREPYSDTSIQTTQSGRELRSTWWTYPRYRYKLTFSFLRSAAAYLEFQKVFGFVARHAGQFDSFLFQDPEDNAVTAHPFGVGTGSLTAYQLQRTLAADADLNPAATRTYWPVMGDGYEPVFDLNGAPSIYVAGALKSAGTDYALGATGAITFTVAPAAGAVLSWTGSYYRRVRFASDQVGADRLVQQCWKTGSIDLVSVKP